MVAPPLVPPAAAAQAWWWRFNDPLLARLVEQALQANGRVVTAQAALRQARALRDVAAAGLGPGVNAAATAQRSQSGSGDGSTRFAASLDASWELDLFGSQRSALQASQATTQGSAASLGDVQVSIAAETGLAYITLRSIQARLAVGEIDAVVFLRDPMTPQPHEPDINALVRASDVHDVPCATNVSTARLLLRQLASQLHAAPGDQP